MKTENISFSSEDIKQFCQKHHIIKLSLFGSILRDDFHADSDVDVLVEFKPGFAPGFDFFAMQDEPSDIIGRRVELHTPDFLSPYFRDNVLMDIVWAIVTKDLPELIQNLEKIPQANQPQEED